MLGKQGEISYTSKTDGGMTHDTGSETTGAGAATKPGSANSYQNVYVRRHKENWGPSQLHANTSIKFC